MLRGGPTWGGVFPEWGAVKTALQITCTCDRNELPSPMSCYWQCGGVTLCLVPPQPCKWCNRNRGDLSCSDCGCKLHTRGQCRVWNRGASRCYLPGPTALHSLCPDCLWVWLQAWMDCPSRRRPSVVVPTLVNHMAGLVAACACGAGSRNARSAPTLTLRRVRRWILRHLRARSRQEGLPLDRLLSRTMP